MTDINIEETKKEVELAEALNRLMQNKDFQLVIRENYLKDYALQLVQLLAGQAAIRDESLMKLFQTRLSGIGSLQQWFQSIIAAGENAKEVLSQIEKGE